MSYITKKPEKLASAIYLITSFFPDQEPLKWRLRGLASDLVSISLYLKDNFSRDREQAGLEVRGVSLEALSLLSVARNSGLVSDANFDIVSREVSKYVNSLALPTGLSEEEGKMMITSDFFAFGASSQRPELPESKTEQKDTNTNSNNVRENTTQNRPDSVLNKQPETRTNYLSDIPKPEIRKSDTPSRPKNLKAFGAVSVKKSARQSVIINLLKRKKEIMIKDVSPLITGCSEKTIQRELLSMVKAGILKKEGEKRWSRYSLA